MSFGSLGAREPDGLPRVGQPAGKAVLSNTPAGPWLCLLALERGVPGERKFWRGWCTGKNERWGSAAAWRAPLRNDRLM